MDPVGNSLLVSAEGDALLGLVCNMIDQLDSAARPQSSMEIREMPGTISVGTLETALRAFAPQGTSSSTNGTAVPERQESRPQPAAGQHSRQSREQPAPVTIEGGE